MSGPSASAAGTSSQPTPTLSTVASKAPQGSSRLFDVPSLNNDGTNFQMWKFRIQTILGVCHIWGVVSRDDTKPDQATHPTEYKEWLANISKPTLPCKGLRQSCTESQIPQQGTYYYRAPQPRWLPYNAPQTSTELYKLPLQSSTELYNLVQPTHSPLIFHTREITNHKVII